MLPIILNICTKKEDIAKLTMDGLTSRAHIYIPLSNENALIQAQKWLEEFPAMNKTCSIVKHNGNQVMHFTPASKYSSQGVYLACHYPEQQINAIGVFSISFGDSNSLDPAVKFAHILDITFPKWGKSTAIYGSDYGILGLSNIRGTYTISFYPGKSKINYIEEENELLDLYFPAASAATEAQATMASDESAKIAEMSKYIAQLEKTIADQKQIIDDQQHTILELTTATELQGAMAEQYHDCM